MGIKKIREYPEIHQQGTISFESQLPIGQHTLEGDLGIQIASDGRVWICIDGVAFLRFRPFFRQKRRD